MGNHPSQQVLELRDAVLAALRRRPEGLLTRDVAAAVELLRPCRHGGRRDGLPLCRSCKGTGLRRWLGREVYIAALRPLEDQGRVTADRSARGTGQDMRWRWVRTEADVVDDWFDHLAELAP